MKTFVALFLFGLIVSPFAQADPNAKMPPGLAEVQTPDGDAHRVEVSLTATEIKLPRSIDGGKCAFVVKNTSEEKLTITVHDPNEERVFRFIFPAQASKSFQVQLQPGVYQTSCVIKGRGEKEVPISLTVR